MQSISLAVMVRDDSARLRRCIESAATAVDEVVVLDTGSNDDTVQVARDAGAKVSEIEWPGSFSAGLNTLLANVRTDWILRLDSDEWFDSDPSDILRSAVDIQENYGYKLVRRDILKDSPYREISIFRLWRSHPKLRYEGLVHENLSNDGISEAFPGKCVENLPLWFWHDGYTHGSDFKLKRNIELVEAELKARPNQPYYRAMRAVMYRDLGHPNFLLELERVADEALLERAPSTRMYAGAFAALLQATPEERIREKRISAVIERSRQWFDSYPGVLWAIGIAETRRGSLDKALEAFLAIQKLSETGIFERSMPFDPNILGPHLWNALGFTANQIGRRDIAEHCARMLQSANKK